MSTATRTRFRLLGGTVLLQGVLFGGLGGAMPVSIAEQKADIVAIAALEGVVPESKSTVDVQLRIIDNLKGPPSPAILSARFTPSPMMQTHTMQLRDLVPKHLIGKTGLWFLNETDGVYVVLPLGMGDFIWEEVFLSLPTAAIPDPKSVIPGLTAVADTTRQIVLAALVESFLATPSPVGSVRDLFWASLDFEENRQDAIAAANAAMASASPEHQIIAMISAIRLGSDEALAVLPQKAPKLQSQRLFPALADALQMYYKPNGESSIRPLRGLIGAPIGGVSFDDAVAAALQKIGTKAVLPAMVELFDSSDPQAQLRAVRFVAEFAWFADANGILPRATTGRIAGPWATATTRAHIPSRQSAMTTEDYVAFWKSWWADNKGKLGFTPF